MTEIIRQARLEDAPGIARVRVDSWRTSYAGIVPDEYLANLSYEKYENKWTNILSDSESKEFVFVAEDEQEQIVGFVAGGPERNNDPVYQGELYAIYLLQSCHHRGIGRRLTLAFVEKLAQEGMHSMLLWVFATNLPARRFYEALDGQLVKTNQFEICGVMLEEVAYGWLDVRALLI